MTAPVADEIRFADATISADDQIDFVWAHRDLFERCRAHNFKVVRARFTGARGRHIHGWEADAEELLAATAWSMPA